MFILGLAGVAAAVIPEACRSGVFACGASEEAPLELAVADEASSAPAAEAAGDSSVAPVATQLVATHEPASITGNDLIAATFSALDLGLVQPAGELNARKVRTVAVGADGQPVAAPSVAEVAPLVPAEEAARSAEASSVSSAARTSSSAEEDGAGSAPEPATVERPSSVPVRVAEASAAPSSEDVGAVGYAPQKGGTALVTGKGANVRSIPQKGGSDVLFALAGGEEVTVVEMSKGWARIVDARGRSGWIYGDYLRR